MSARSTGGGSISAALDLLGIKIYCAFPNKKATIISFFTMERETALLFRSSDEKGSGIISKVFHGLSSPPSFAIPQSRLRPIRCTRHGPAWPVRKQRIRSKESPDDSDSIQ